MTTEEIKELSRLEEVYRVKSYNQTNYDDTVLIVRNTKAAAVIDFIRKDLKKIVADAVKEAVGTLNRDKKSLSPDDSALQDLAETIYGNWIQKELSPIDETGKHPLDTAAFNYKSTRLLLDSYGVHYLEDIKGYISGNLAESTVPIISIGEFPNGILNPIPVDNFEDIGIAMQANNIPFKRICNPLSMGK